MKGALTGRFTLRSVVRPKSPVAMEGVFRGFRGLLGLVLRLPPRGRFLEVYRVTLDAHSLSEAGPKTFALILHDQIRSRTFLSKILWK